MPNALLARYFAARGVLAEMDFAAQKEAKPEPLFAAWLELPEGQRNAMDAELVRPAWAHSYGCKSRHKLVTVSEVKRNCMRVTDCGEEAWIETAGR
jgi:hypothetical protein